MPADTQLRIGILLLHLGNVKETQVGGLEQGNANWEVDTHTEVLNIVRKDSGHRRPDWICDLPQNPVDMQHKNGRE